MIGLHIKSHLRRNPLPLLAIVLFTALAGAALCLLHWMGVRKTQDYEAIYTEIPVRCTVTDLTGTKSDHLMIYRWVPMLLDGSYPDDPDFAGYVRDVKKKGSLVLKDADSEELIYANDIEMTPALWPDNGCVIFWNEGYDASMFGADDDICLLPQSMAGDAEITLTATTSAENGASAELRCTVAGYYVGVGTAVYLPWSSGERLTESLHRTGVLDALRFTLRDNHQLADFRERAGAYFAEPKANGAKTPCTLMHYQNFPYALDIDDSLLLQAEKNLRSGLLLYSLTQTLIFLLTAGAGFLAGFLTIRQQSREILLMRTMGMPPARIFAVYFAEQTAVSLSGCAIGGAAFGWNPPGYLLALWGLYETGACAAIILFLARNLLNSMKEENE